MLDKSRLSPDFTNSKTDGEGYCFLELLKNNQVFIYCFKKQYFKIQIKSCIINPRCECWGLVSVK
jgi:hypothetical protein